MEVKKTDNGNAKAAKWTLVGLAAIVCWYNPLLGAAAMLVLAVAWALGRIEAKCVGKTTYSVAEAVRTGAPANRTEVLRTWLVLF